MKQGQCLFAAVLVVMLVVLAGCNVAQPYTVSQYGGIAHSADGKVWLTGTTTLYGDGYPKTTAWVQVCLQDPHTTVPKLLCERVLVEDAAARLMKERAKQGSDLDRNEEDDDEDDEGEDEDGPTQPAPAKGHPLDPKNQVPADDR